MCIDTDSKKKPTREYKVGFKVVFMTSKDKFGAIYFSHHKLDYQIRKKSPDVPNRENKNDPNSKGYHIFVHLKDAIYWAGGRCGKFSIRIIRCKLGKVLFQAKNCGDPILVVESFTPTSIAINI